MITQFTRLALLPLSILWVSAVIAQNPVKRIPIELLSPKGSDIGQPGQVIYKHTGNVKLRHQGVLLFCDQAIQYVTANRLEATGHVLIVQGDTIIVKADTLVYNGTNRQATLHGRVTFQDRRIILNAAQLDYDLTSGVAHYANRGRLVDSRNVLTSREGYYDTRTRQIEMKQGVRLVSSENTLTSDLLVYNTISRFASIVAPTRITGKEGVSVARQGQYDTQNSQIQPGTTAEILKYVATNDLPDGVAPAETSLAKSNVSVPTKADATLVVSQNDRFGAPGESVVTYRKVEKPVDKSIGKPVAMVAVATPTEKKSPLEEPSKTSVAKPVATGAAMTTNGVKSLPDVPVNQAKTATVAEVLSEKPNGPKPSIAVKSPIATASQSINPAETAVAASRPARSGVVNEPAPAIVKTEKQVAGPPVTVAAATVDEPKRPLNVPAKPVKVTVATIESAPEKPKTASGAKAEVFVKGPTAPSGQSVKPSEPVVVARQDSRPIADSKPGLARVALEKPVEKPIAKPIVAVVIPAEKKSALLVPVKQVETITAVKVAPEKSKTASEATPKVAVESPVVPVREPVAETPLSTVAVTALTQKPDDQATLAAVDTRKAAVRKVETQKEVRPAVPARLVANPQPERTGTLRAVIVSAAKRVITPVAVVTPDSEVSELERELNRKKRIR